MRLDLDECSLWVVPSMAWVPPGLGISRIIYGQEQIARAKLAWGPNVFKFRRAARQKVLSGGKNRPIVEEAVV